MSVSTWTPPKNSGKWTASLVPAAGMDTYQELVGGDHFEELKAWGETSLGAVTGNNGYFAMSKRLLQELDLPRSEVVRISPPGSTHLRSLSLSRRQWEDLGASGARTYLFRPGVDPSPAAQRYIHQGIAAGVDRAYKCRVRTPRWRPPVLAPPDLFLTYMNAAFPQLASNPSRLRHLNSVHGVYLRPEVAALGTEILPLACLNSVTLLGAEAVGRSYGGGMLKLEPKEADLLPVPSPHLLHAVTAELAALISPVRVLLANGNSREAIRLVDDVLLGAALGVGDASIRSLETAREHMVSRRKARGNGGKGN